MALRMCTIRTGPLLRNRHVPEIHCCFSSQSLNHRCFIHSIKEQHKRYQSASFHSAHFDVKFTTQKDPFSRIEIKDLFSDHREQQSHGDNEKTSDKHVMKNDKRFPKTKVAVASSVSRGKIVLDDLFSQLVSEGNCRYLSVGEWEKVEEGAKSMLGGLESTWTIRFLEYLSSKPSTEGLLELAESLEIYIQQRRQVSELFLKVGRMHLLLNQGAMNAEEEILKLYDKLCIQYDVFDASSLSRIMTALCLTHRWKQCLDLLEMYSITAVVGTRQYSPIVAAAFRNGEDSIAYDLMETVFQIHEQPLDMAYHPLLQRNNLDDTEKLLHFLCQKDWIVSEEVAKQISDVFKWQAGHHWDVQHITAKKTRNCENCGDMLQPVRMISKSEFLELRDRFMETSLVKKDIFQNSSPEELDRFKSMLRDHGSFDIVIDGLNTAHGLHQKATATEKVKVLRAVVEHFAVAKQQKVLVLGRNHMKGWPRKAMEQIEELAHCFYTSDSSQDDTFVLYAALSSSPHTLFVTRDEFRDHRILLGHQYTRRFKHWQLSRQVPFLGQFPDKRTGKPFLSFKWPNKYQTCVQPSTHGWHIPYEDGKERASYQVPNTWLCLTRR